MVTVRKNCIELKNCSLLLCIEIEIELKQNEKKTKLMTKEKSCEKVATLSVFFCARISHCNTIQFNVGWKLNFREEENCKISFKTSKK
jgi:hypothetical protein